MMIRQHLNLIFLGSLVAISPMACAMPKGEVQEISQQSQMPEQSLEALIAADIVCLGERHDSKKDHQAQLEIIRGIHAASPSMAIALEMFQRPFQEVMDQYIAGEITETEFLAQSEYEQRWGFPWELYAPILQFARENKIPVLALNAPNETVSQVAREGLESITNEDLAYIPPVADLDLSNVNYRNFVQGAFGMHGQHGNFDFDNFFAAQVIWDETMAETISEFHRLNPDTKIVTLAGQGHVIYGYGIPDRVQRRLGEAVKTQIVLLNPVPEITVQGRAIADMFWWTAENPETEKP